MIVKPWYPWHDDVRFSMVLSGGLDLLMDFDEGWWSIWYDTWKMQPLQSRWHWLKWGNGGTWCTGEKIGVTCGFKVMMTVGCGSVSWGLVWCWCVMLDCAYYYNVYFKAVVLCLEHEPTMQFSVCMYFVWGRLFGALLYLIQIGRAP